MILAKSHAIITVVSMANFNDMVRTAINNCGLTRYEIAQRADITEGALSRFVTGKRDMTLKTLERIAPVIGVRLVVDRPKGWRKDR